MNDIAILDHDNEIAILDHEEKTKSCDKSVHTCHFANFGKGIRLTSSLEKDTVVTVTKGSVQIIDEYGNRIRIDQGCIFIIKRGKKDYKITSKLDITRPQPSDASTAITLVT